MYVDPTGHILISTILLWSMIVGTIIGAAIGGTVKGVQAAQDGASGWEVLGQVMLGIGVGGGLGALIGFGIGAGAAGIMSIGGALAFAGGGSAGMGAVAVGVCAIAAGGVVTVGSARELEKFLGSNIVFSKDPYVKHLEKGMSEFQKEMFQREIEDYKKSEGRGGADNLPKEILREIAEWVKKWYRGQ